MFQILRKSIIKTKVNVLLTLATTDKMISLKISKLYLTPKIKLTSKETPVKKRLQKILSTKEKQASKDKKPTKSCIIKFESSHSQQ